MAAWPLHWPGWRVRLRSGFRPGQFFTQRSVIRPACEGNVSTWALPDSTGIVALTSWSLTLKIYAQNFWLPWSKVTSKPTFRYRLFLRNSGFISVRILFFSDSGWKDLEFLNWNSRHQKISEPRIWSTLFEEGMARWTSPDWLQIPQMRSFWGGCVSRKVKVTILTKFFGEIHFKLIRNQYPCSSNKSFISLPQTSILHWNNPPCEIHGNSVQAEVAQAAKRQFRELRRTFHIFSLCVPEKQGDSDFGIIVDQLEPTQIISSCVIQLMIFLVRSMVLLVLDACGVLGNLMLAFFALRILAFGQDRKWGGIVWIGWFWEPPKALGAWQDSLSSDEIYHTYSLMVWQSICAIFHSGILEFGDREMLFFLLLSSI